MKTIVTVITEGFAEWETALVNGAAAGFYGMRTRFAAPGGKMVTSAGGMRVIPDVALEALIVDDFDALLVCGGTAWQNPGAPDIGELLFAARKAGKLIGIICDGTVAAARTGLLDDIAHTSNGAGYLDETGYAGKARYQDVPHAVVDQGVITAPGSAPVSFMAAVIKELGMADEGLDFYVGLHAAQFAKAA